MRLREIFLNSENLMFQFKSDSRVQGKCDISDCRFEFRFLLERAACAKSSDFSTENMNAALWSL
jgi:hypothetical protein